MGKRGPQSRPTNVKVLHGERNQDRLNFHEPQTQQGRPVPPEDMSDEARAVFEEAAWHLECMGLTERADAQALTCYAEAVVVHRQASAQIARDGIVVEGASGGLVKHPAAQLQRDNAHTIRQFCQEFGFTPSARSGIKAPEKAAGAEPFHDAG